jgi:hypothetical protein
MEDAWDKVANRLAASPAFARYARTVLNGGQPMGMAARRKWIDDATQPLPQQQTKQGTEP